MTPRRPNFLRDPVPSLRLSKESNKERKANCKPDVDRLGKRWDASRWCGAGGDSLGC